jgi:hypothetical protein
MVTATRRFRARQENDDGQGTDAEVQGSAKAEKEKPKTIAANPSQKGGARGLETMEHLKNS